MRLSRFSAMLPAASSRHLPVGAAAYAENTRTTNGTLRAMRTPLSLLSCSSSLGLNAAGEYTCRPLCSVTPLSCGGDTVSVPAGEIMYSDGSPVVPSTPAVPTVSPISNEGVTTAFRVSTLGVRGNESPMSPPTALVKVPASGNITLATDGRVRVYALVGESLDGKLPASGETSANWVVVGDFDSPARFPYDPTTWALSTDTMMDEMCAPKDVDCLAQDEVGHIYAWNKTTIWISDRNSEYAFPLRGQITIEHNIKKVVPYYDSAIVVTDGKPFLIRPQMNDQGVMNPLTIPYAAHHGLYGPVSAIAPADMGVIYPSREGLILLTPQAPLGFKLLTRDIVHGEDWRTLWAPATLAYHNGLAVSDRWVMEVTDQQHGVNPLGVFTLHSFPVERLQSLPDGRLVGFSSDTASQWFAGSYASAEYHSEVSVQQGKRVFTAAKLVGENLGGVTFSLLDADTHSVLYTRVIQTGDNNQPFRLPAVRRQHYVVRLTLPAGDKEVVISEVHLGPDINDLTRPEGVAN